MEGVLLVDAGGVEIASGDCPVKLSLPPPSRRGVVTWMRGRLGRGAGVSAVPSLLADCEPDQAPPP